MTVTAKSGARILEFRSKISDLESAKLAAMHCNPDAMKDRTKRFALIVIRLCRNTKPSQEGRIIVRQLLRSATSVAANYRAVCRARSRPDFISKLGIVLEEADESLFWLELLLEAGIVSPDVIKLSIKEANELVSIFVTSLRTARGLQSPI
jgi:four helix bundle protein